MASSTLTVSGNHSYSSGTITYTGGSSNYTVMNDASDSTYALVTVSNGYGSWPLTDTASNLGTVTAVTINLRMGEFGLKGDQITFAGAQIYKSDGTTAITSNCTATSGFIANFSLTPSSIFYTDKTSWDGAVLRLKNSSNIDGGMAYYEVSVDITYSVAATTYNETGSGGAIAGGAGSVKIRSSRTATGGTIAGGVGSVRIRSSKTATGGVIVGGAVTEKIRFYKTGTGGVIVSGTIENTEYRLPNKKTGIGRCIIGNPLFEVPNPENQLIKPKYFMEQTSLKANPRQQVTGVWCQVEESCDGVLPKIIQKRQKGFLPNSTGTINARDRGIAKA